MNWPKKRTFTPMHRAIWISSIVLACSAVASAQPGVSPLARAVQPPLADAPLSGMLALLSRQSGVPISYSSSRIGGQRRCRVRPGPPRPLGTVLHEVAGQFRLSYGMLNGQLVLWPAAEPAPPGVAELNSLGQSARRQPLASSASKAPKAADAPVITEAISPVTASGRSSLLVGRAAGPGRSGIGSRPPVAALENRLTGQSSDGGVRVSASLVSPLRAGTGETSEGRSKRLLVTETKPGFSNAEADPIGGAQLTVRGTAAAKGVARATHGPAAKAARSARPPSATVSPSLRSARDTEPMTAAESAILPRVVTLVINANATPETAASLPPGPAPQALARPQTAVRRRPAQVSLLPPLSSNWLANARTVNTYSLNVLAGYSAGVSRLELGGLLNVVRDSVHGLQAAGLANVTGTDVRGVQLAGLANVNGGAVRGVQGAGLVNIARDDARGLQIAGWANITGGAVHARQRPDQPTRLRRWPGLQVGLRF